MKKWKLFFLQIGCALFFGFHANGQPFQQAQLIVPVSLQDSSISNSWICYKKRLDLNQLPVSAQTKIAVDSKYWLWVNDSLVIREGGLKRGPNPTDSYYDQLDIRPFLKTGENVISILVWYFGKHGFSHNDSGQSGLMWESDELNMYSDENWRAIIHPAFLRKTSSPHPNFRLPESNILFDARKDLEGWYKRSFDESGWPKATPVSHTAWGNFGQRPIPFWKDYGLKIYGTDLTFPFQSQGDTLIMDLPYNMQLTPYFEIEAPTGKNIDIRTDNYRGGSAPNVRIEYVSKGGMHTFESPAWINGHQVRYYFPEGVKIYSLKYRESGYATDFAGNFSCDDDFYNRLWQKAARTLYITMRDTYMDCPDRERSQWWGDVVNELGETFYSLDTRSHLLTRKAILELMAWQRPDSTIFSPVPAGNWDKELPMQMLASVSYYGFWTYFMHSGDTATIKTVYPAVDRYLRVWKVDQNGLVIPRSGGWTWGDWGTQKDMQLLYNGWYYLALKGYQQMAALLKRPEAANWAEERMLRLAKAFNEQFWTGTSFRHPNYKGETDDRSQALAVVSGIASPEKYAAIREVLMEEQHASPYMEKYVLEALVKMGYVEDALIRMKERFEKMIESPLTTLWEGWGIGKEGFGGGTYNHAWSGGGLTILSQYIAGIQPIQAGYKEFEVWPRPGYFQNVKARVPSVRGYIDLELSSTVTVWNLKLKVPVETKAQVRVPIMRKKRVRLNGQLIWEEGKLLGPVNGFQVERKQDCLLVPLSAGQWKIESR